MHSFLLLASLFKRASEPYEFAFAAILFVFHQSQKPRTQILSLFILAAILNKFPPSVDKLVTWFLLCARVFYRRSAILKSSRRRPWGRGWHFTCAESNCQVNACKMRRLNQLNAAYFNSMRVSRIFDWSSRICDWSSVVDLNAAFYMCRIELKLCK